MRTRRPRKPSRLAVLCAASSDEEMERTRQTASMAMDGVGMLHAAHHVIGSLYIRVGQGGRPNSIACSPTLTAASIHRPLDCGRADQRRYYVRVAPGGIKAISDVSRRRGHIIDICRYVEREELMTSCRSSFIERICRRNACTSHADSCRIVVW